MKKRIRLILFLNCLITSYCISYTTSSEKSNSEFYKYSFEEKITYDKASKEFNRHPKFSGDIFILGNFKLKKDSKLPDKFIEDCFPDGKMGKIDFLKGREIFEITRKNDLLCFRYN